MTFRLPGSDLLAEIRDAASGSGPVIVRAAPETIAAISPTPLPPTSDRDEAQATLGQVPLPDASDSFRDADGAISVVGADGNVVEAPDEVQDAAPDPGVCDVCTAAKLAEDGVMPSRVAPEELHTRCKHPGNCACGCAYSRGGRCANCGRTRPFDQLACADGQSPECVDRAECAKAMLDRTPAPEPARTPKKATSATKRLPRPPSDRPSRSAAPPRPCGCGCGEVTGGGTYRPGHDSRHVKTLVAAVRAEGLTLEAAVGQLPSDALRAKLQKQLEAS